MKIPPLPASAPITAILLCALAASACATTPSLSTKENPAMSTESTPESSVAALSAQEISKRVLTLIENIRGPQDISPETIERYTGQKVWFDPNNKNRYGVSGKLTAQWHYGLASLSPETPDEKPKSLLFDFNEQTHSGADMSPICVPLESFSAPLTEAGFTAKQFRNRLNTKAYWYFARDAIGVKIHLRGKKNSDDPQTCVSMVTISTYS